MLSCIIGTTLLHRPRQVRKDAPQVVLLGVTQWGLALGVVLHRHVFEMKVTRRLPFNMTGRSVRCLNVGLTSRVPVRPASHQDSESTVVIVRCSSNHGTEDNDDCGANRPAPGDL